MDELTSKAGDAEEFNEGNAQPQGVESCFIPAEADKDTAAKRIKLKRKIKRRQRLRALQRAILMLLLLLIFYMIGYVFNDVAAYRGQSRIRNAKASEAQPSEVQRLYSNFATAEGTDLKIAMPGRVGSVIGVGFHQAERKEALAIIPIVPYLNRETTTSVRELSLNSNKPVFFVMDSRGRGTKPTSAMDVAMVPGAEILSPVDGVVTTVKVYSLYGKITDFHIEIQPDGYPNLRVAMIHIDNVQVKIGQGVERQTTVIGRLRPLPGINSQVNRYLPEVVDHVHVQINPSTVNVNGELGS